jgi:exonuclease III
MPGPTGPVAPPFSCVVVNVNGMRSRPKRRSLFSQIGGLRYAVVLLVETHCKSDEEARAWTQEGAGPGMPWEGTAFWNHGNSQSRGVAILVRAGISVGSPTIQYRDADGRLLRVGLKLQDDTLCSFLAVYAPTEPGHRTAFFAGPCSEACAAGPAGASLMVAGDFNCVVSARDVQTATGLPEGNSRLVGGPALAQLQEERGLRDVWRELHPREVEFTRITRSTGGVHSSGRTSRWLVSEELVQGGWMQACTHVHGQLPGDHAAVSLQVCPPGQPLFGKPGWVFPTYLLQSEEYMDMMSAFLAECVGGMDGSLSPEAQWEDLKVQVKLRTLQFSLEGARDRRRARSGLVSKVWGTRSLFCSQPQDAHAAQAFQAAVDALQRHDQNHAAAKAVTLDAVWAASGEQSTAWFHRLGRTDLDRQPLGSVRDPQGSPPADLRTAEGCDRARDLLADFFDGEKEDGLFRPAEVDQAAQDLLLGAVGSRLADADQRACLGPSPDGSITPGCALAALQSMPAGKRPGSDGLPYEFYTKFWEVLHPLMLAAFNGAFLSGAQDPALSWVCRTGLVLLIYKGGDKPRDDPDSYRPITLLNCDVKIIAKVLVRRLSGPLQTVLDPCQTAFVPGRWIGDNVLSHLEEVDYVVSQDLSACILGLDYNKAYDRIHRGWLNRCMEALGVPAEAQRWVRLLMQDSEAQVVYNGFLSRRFKVLAGCAQGNPLSPLLYVMAAQPLAARCRQLQVQGLVDAIPLPDGGLASPIHQHADDTTLHTATVQSAAVMIAEAVTPFCKASGGQVSLHKSWGLTLGSHPPLVGPHAATGVPFLAPHEAVRHLGVPLTSGAFAPHVQALYAKRLKAVCARIRHWARYDLSLLGRVHIAKQVLASVLSYHAMFVPPPADALSRLQRVVDGYVLSGTEQDEDAVAPLRGAPSRYVTVLPRHMGGLAHVDMEVYTSALQGKVAAALLHPARRQWKVLMSAAFDRAAPGIGVAALLQQAPCAGQAALPALGCRHASYLATLRSAGVYRGMARDAMSVEQVKVEQLLGNVSVGSAVGDPCTSVASLPSEVRVYRTLGQVPQAALQALTLPSSWEALLGAPVGQPQWEMEVGGQVVRQVQGQGWSYFSVQADGRLDGVDDGPVAATWVAACVADCARPQPGSGPGPLLPVYYLVGPWPSVRIDPTVWCVAGCPLLRYTVRGAAAAMVQWRCRKAPGWVPGVGVRPKLWGVLGEAAAAGVVADMAGRQKRRWEEAFAAPGPSARQRAWLASDLAPVYHAPWFDPSPPRAHVRQRVADREPVVTHQRRSQRPPGESLLQDDTVDPICGYGAGDALWQGVWQRVHYKGLPRPSRVFAWRLLHGALRVGGATVRFYTAGHPDLGTQPLCRFPCCRGPPAQLETLQHLFLECPVGKGALLWLAGMWGRLESGRCPPVDAIVMLADDPSAWAPQSSALGRLWTVLRVTMLKRIWVASRAEHLGSTAAQACRSVVFAFVAEVCSLIRQDWLLVLGDLREESGVGAQWLRGRSLSLPLAQFQSRWCIGGVLAAADVTGHGQAVDIRLSVMMGPLPAEG